MFTTASLAPRKNRHAMFVSLLAIAGIFLTTMVLATNEPVSVSQSQVIQLPQTGNSNHPLLQKVSLSPNDAPQHSQSIEIGSQTGLDSETVTPAVSTPTIDLESANITEVERQHLDEAQSIDTQSLSESSTDNEPENNIPWQTVEVKSGDNLSLIFPRVGLSARDVYNVVQTDDADALLNLRPGQILRVAMDEEDGKQRLQALQLALTPTETLVVEATDSGFSAITHVKEMEKRQQIVGGQIQSSLFLDAQKAGMSDKLIMELAHIFGWDIDFALDLRQGDSFKVIYNENYLDGDKVDDGEILAAEFTNRGKSFRAIRFTDKSGASRYYTPEGASMRKAFTRTPVPISRISSGFNPNRLHPVLKTKRPHRGVDYAAPTGTPILATGDGKVIFVGTKGGYGRTVILSHGGRYTTLFAHMSKYKKGLRVGQRVRQGETIGYIGSSGLATGPHLHYEFRVDDVHKNPLTVVLPKAEALPAELKEEFASLSHPLVAQLDNVTIPSLALSFE
ncbi:Peptidase, M23/M37 family [Methylophaga frappieri]|uniref:Peptidase, M23/M37 family n=1 Tax=Methylophaga frappieri (strain ATCC BAA-2434 / DSM 25690 / JAM7) TaxID=754477 RepID=I1YGW8_METFJ|nr:peptidoglycan DD-metalloendopeptidase family protein [Methylophaga frappieri]AFJ02161.1 Peptidase, M23/M37 family [Methylophaga frappieri]